MSYSLAQKQKILDGLKHVVQEVGEGILNNFSGPVRETEFIGGHWQTTVDAFAQKYIVDSLKKYLGPEEYPDFLKEVNCQFEVTAPEDVQGKKCKLLIDEVDGTVNVLRYINYKNRGIKSKNPKAVVSIALLNEFNNSIEVGAVYAMDEREVYSGIRVKGGYEAFRGEMIIDPEKIQKQEDDVARIIVAGYTNTNRAEKAKIESLILKDHEKNHRVDGGCGSSTVDILDIIRGTYDAYLDPRALWGEKWGSVLQDYDIAGVYLTALGSGLPVSNLFGGPIKKHTEKEGLDLLVSRNEKLHKELLEAIQPYVEKYMEK